MQADSPQPTRDAGERVYTPRPWSVTKDRLVSMIFFSKTAELSYVASELLELRGEATALRADLEQTLTQIGFVAEEDLDPTGFDGLIIRNAEHYVFPGGRRWFRKAAALAANDPAPAGEGWRETDRELPECEQMVVVAFADGEVTTAWRLHSSTRCIWSKNKTNVPITHWMPLPPAPRDESREKGEASE